MQQETEAIVAISRELSPAATAAAIAGVLLAFSRQAPLLAKLWGHLPKPLPAVIPAIVTLLPSSAEVFQKDTVTWGGLVMNVLVALGILAAGYFEAAHPKSKEDPKRNDDDDDDKGNFGPFIPKKPKVVSVPPDPIKDEPSVAIAGLALIVGGLAMLIVGCAGNTPPPKAGCSDEAYAALTVECAAAAAKCVADGGAESRCGEVCDSRAEKWEMSCR